MQVRAKGAKIRTAELELFAALMGGWFSGKRAWEALLPADAATF